MRVLFCNIEWMNSYNGINDEVIISEGSLANERQILGECFNFALCEDDHYHGYVSTRNKKGTYNQLHIEKLEGVAELDDKAENVLVIWTAKDPYSNKNYIIGWYKNATVTRNYYENDGLYKNIYAKSNDCVLLPINKRHKIVPKSGKDGYSYGMGQTNVWFGKKEDPKANLYIKNMVEYINNYNGENLAQDNIYVL